MPPFARLGAGFVAEALRAAGRELLPPACLLCDGPTGSGGEALVCALCRSRWQRLPEPLCQRCGQPRDSVTVDLACRICAVAAATDGDAAPALARARSAVWLDDGARRAVHLLKYDGWWRLAEAMARVMTRLEPLTGEVSLMAVPLAARRLRARGYNQAQSLAAALSAQCGAPLSRARLVRVRETTTQTELAPELRAVNVAGAFRAEGVRGVRVVLVDDVFTTGATLRAAARALVAAGAAQVDAVTFGRAVVPVH
jgi:ComF family protein